MALEASNFIDYFDRGVSTDPDAQVLAFPAGLKAHAGFKYYTKSEILQLTNKAAAYFHDHGIQPRQAGTRSLQIALFGYGTVEWAVCFFTIIRMGHKAFSLSSRLSEEYTNGLVVKSKTQIIVSDRPMHLKDPITTIQMPTEAEIDKQTVQDVQALVADASIISPGDIAFTVHSSGSTSLPKLLPISHNEILSRIRATVLGVKTNKTVWGASALYNTGGLLGLSMLPSRCVPMYVENDRVAFTQSGAVAFAKEAQAQQMMMSPWTLQMLSSDPEGLEMLKQADIVGEFGAVLPDAIGDFLVREGVNLFSHYGLTEAWALALGPSQRETGDTDWQWVIISPDKLDMIEMRPLSAEALGKAHGSTNGATVKAEGTDLYQMWCSPTCPGVLPSVRDPETGFFCTGDLFLKHPTKEGRWKVVGRQDDQLKIYVRDRQSIVNAVSYEGVIIGGNDDIVDDIVLFGQGRAKLGVLAFSEGANPGSKKSQQVEQRVWDTIEERVNNKLPTPIDRDMIIVVDTKHAALPQTAKYNLIRPQVYRKYEDLIEKAYEAKGGGQTNGVSTNGH